MKIKISAFFILFFCALALGAWACGDGEFERFGAECDVDEHCADGSICLRGGDYPGGFCSFPCDHSSQCPVEAACVDKRGGVCLFQCQKDRHCPYDYECKKKSFKGSAGKVRVCMGD